MKKLILICASAIMLAVCPLVQCFASDDDYKDFSVNESVKENMDQEFEANSDDSAALNFVNRKFTKKNKKFRRSDENKSKKEKVIERESKRRYKQGKSR